MAEVSVVEFGDGDRKLVIGMVHLDPLPGTPFHRDGSLPEIIEAAVAAARALQLGGADGCLIQSVDRVYPTGEEVDPARVGAMALVVRAVVESTGGEFSVGVHLLRNAARASLAVARVAGGSFVRADALVGRTLSANGIVQPDPLSVMAYRRSIDAFGIRMFADIDSMHYRWTGRKSTAEVARYAVTAGADAVCVSHPDVNRTLDTVASIRATTEVPIVIAGRTDHSNVTKLIQNAHGVFVGTCLKSDRPGSPIDLEKVRRYVAAVREAEGLPGAAV